MLYNIGMQAADSHLHINITRVLRIALVIWLGYLLILFIVDLSIHKLGPAERIFYSANTIFWLLLIGIASFSWLQRRLAKAFVPLIIFIISALPIAVNQLIFQYIVTVEMHPAPEVMSYRVLPFLFIALSMMVWQYKWKYVVFFSLGIVALNLGLFLAYVPTDAPSFRYAISVVCNQTISFVIGSFFIYMLVAKLRQQQRYLEEANLQLTHHANTLDKLATSRERNRLARELHDTMAHTLSGLVIQLETVKAYMDTDTQVARAKLEKSLTIGHSGLTETRRALKALRASPLEEFGLELAIKLMAEDSARQAGLTLDLSVTDNLPALSHDVEQCIYRIAEEAITNAIIHARANTLAVKFEFKNGKVTLEVRDDGVGFDAKLINKDDNLGLTGMKERACFAGGELNITSQPGHGATVQLIISRRRKA